MMKKIFALLLVLSMALCFVACGTTEEPTPGTPACTAHVDANGDGICDTAGCGATVEKGDNGETGDDIKGLAEKLVGDGASLSKVNNVTGEYVKTVYVDANGKGYVVHVLVPSQYGSAETETLVYINAEGKLAGVNKLVFKTSDAMYGYVPPAAEVVDAFYAKLTGKTLAEFKAAFTGEGVELVTNATSTSTKLVASIVEAFEVVEAVKNSGATVPMDPALATTYVNAIWSAVENAKTITAKYETVMYQSTSDAVAEDGEVIFEGYEDTVQMSIEITLAMTETGISVKMTGTVKEDDDVQEIEAYVVDGVCYGRIKEGAEWDEWEVTPIEIPEEANGMITQLGAIITQMIPADFEITTEMIDEVKAAFAEAFTAALGVNPDGSFGVRVDTKDAIDAVLAFIKSIEADDTVGEIINSVLAMIDPEMTIESILDEIGANGAITVGEIYAALDAAFVEQFGMGINDIKNALLAEEAIVAMLVEQGIADEETLAAIAETDVEVMMADYLEMTLDDLVYMIFAAQSSPEPEVQPMTEEPVEEPVDTTGMLAMMVEEIKAMLAMTLEEAAGIDYEMMMASIDAIEIRANYAYLTFKIADDLSIEKIEIGQKLDYTFGNTVRDYREIDLGEGNYDYIVIEGYETLTMTQETVFVITSVSNVETVITAPEIAE